MIYLDTSVLLVYTLARQSEPARCQATTRLFEKINTYGLSATASFYALHEVFIFAIQNAPDFSTGCAFGKLALQEILATPIQITPLLSRTDRRCYTPKVSPLLVDPSDIPHAISALLSGCDTIVAYDEHFRRLSPLLAYKTPEELI